MKTNLKISLVILIILAASSHAWGTVPGDLDGDKIVSDEELKTAEQLYSRGNISSEELQEIRHIHDRYPRIVKDSTGKEIAIYKPVERIAVLTVDDYEIIRILDATDKVVAVNMYVAQSVKKLYPEGGRYANIGAIITSPDYEALIKAEPDVVITYLNYPKPGEIEKNLGSDIPVIRWDSGNISEYTDIINKTGYLLEKENEARNYTIFFEETLGKYLRAVKGLSDLDKPRVYLEADFGGGRTYFTCGSGHAHNVLVTAAGGNNIFSDLQGFKQVDPESVVIRDPEIILVYKYLKNSPGIEKDLSDTTALEAVRDEMLSRPELQGVQAIKNKKVYVYTWDCTRGGARFYLGLGYIGKWLHPSIFQDYSPREAYQEYLKRFQGVDIDVINKGVFVYPESA